MNPTVKQIVEMYLRANGYDGLYNEDAECWCEVDNLDAEPTNCITNECCAGYTTTCDCGEHECHIGPVKELE